MYSIPLLYRQLFQAGRLASLTKVQSFSTASKITSWCPILWTPNLSKSWEVNWSSSTPDKCHSETGYWFMGASRPGHKTTADVWSTNWAQISSEESLSRGSHASGGMKKGQICFAEFSDLKTLVSVEKNMQFLPYV